MYSKVVATQASLNSLFDTCIYMLAVVLYSSSMLIIFLYASSFIDVFILWFGYPNDPSTLDLPNSALYLSPVS